MADDPEEEMSEELKNREEVGVLCLSLVEAVWKVRSILGMPYEDPPIQQYNYVSKIHNRK